MTFETLNDNVMLVELSGDEMEKFHITYESLNGDNEKTQTALKNLLCRIDADNRISKGENVLVEALPTENGGCFFIFTFTRINKRRYKVKRNDMSLILQTDNLDDLLDFVSAVKNRVITKQKCEAFKMDSNYFLFIPKGDDRLNAVIGEYGANSENMNYERLKEYGKNLGKVYLQ